ncbi:DUF4347 domain-containing protein [Yangia sp. PrR007]|nr:DUF4347 domain-containing protein [Salipiger sp. PrR007]NDW34601.1 DUF4347 domain-containing protein [Salipiger sp. PrR007]
MSNFARDKVQVAFIDMAAPDLDVFSTILKNSCEVIRIGETSDPLQEMADALNARAPVDTVHVITHGTPGALVFGGRVFDIAVLDHYADTLNALGGALGGGDILLYGCRTGAGETGRAFVARFAGLTGAAVAAAEGPVGAAALGGSWDLSITSGELRSAALELPEFEGVLASGIMQNRYVRFGYSDDGTLGYGGNTTPGIFYDPDGVGNFVSTADWLTPGTAFEGFSLTADGRTYTELNSNGGGAATAGTVQVSTDLTTEGGNTWGSVTYSSEFGGLIVEQTYTLAGPDAKVITMSVTVINSGDSSVYDVSYARFIDPDVDAQTSTFSTENTRGAEGIDAEDIVLATGPNSGRVLGLYSDSTFTHNTSVSTGWSQAPATYLSGVDGDGGSNSDSVIGMGFDLGDFAAGESKTFSLAYVFSPSAAELADSVAEVPPSNAVPTLTDIAVVDSTLEDTQLEISYADLAAQADEADSDGTVVAFSVTAVTSGTLLIGTSLETATAWAVGSNDRITDTLNAYWTPGADENGTLDAFSVVAVDDEGATSSPAQSVQIDVTAVNDRIVLAAASVDMPTVQEDSTDRPGVTVDTLLAPISSDADAGDGLAGIALTANATDGEGSWQYSTDGGSTWFELPSVTTDAALTLDADARLRFVPAADYNGDVPALTVYALDGSYAGDYTDGATTAVTDASAPAADGPFSETTVTIGGDVAAVNDAPVFTSTITPVSISETSAADGALADLVVTGSLTQGLTAIDVDSDELSFSIRGGTLTDGVWTLEGRYGVLTLDTATNAWSYAPTHWTAINALSEGQIANDVFTLRVADEQGASSTQELRVSLTGANDTPVITAAIADQSFEGDGTWVYQLPAATVFDAEGTGLSYTATLVGGADLPDWLSFDEASRTFSGNPPADWSDASLEIEVTATDADGASVSGSFTLTLSGTGNQAPVVVTPLGWTAVDAPSEVTSVTFSGMLGGQTIAFDGAEVTLGEKADGATVASAAATAINDDGTAGYSASASGSTLTLTAGTAGSRSDFTDGATVDIDGGSYAVTVTQEGVDEVTETAAVQFRVVPGATTLSFDGQDIDITGLTAAQIASAVAAAVNGAGNWDAVVDGVQADVVNFTARDGGARDDLSAADFQVSVSTIATAVTVDTQGAEEILPAAAFDVTDTEAGTAGTFSFTSADSGAISVDVSTAASGSDLAALLNADTAFTGAGYSAAWTGDVLTITGPSGDAISAPSLVTEEIPAADLGETTSVTAHSETLPTLTFDLGPDGASASSVHNVDFTSSLNEALRFGSPANTDGAGLADELNADASFSGAGYVATYDAESQSLIITGLAGEVLSDGALYDPDDLQIGTGIATAYSETPSRLEIAITDEQSADAATLTLTLSAGEPVTLDVSAATDGATLAALIDALDGFGAGYTDGTLTVTVDADAAGDPSITAGALETAVVPPAEIDAAPEVTNATDAVAEVVDVTFGAADGTTEISFDGATIALDGTETAAQVAAAFASGAFPNWTVTDNGDGSVTLTADTAGGRDDLTGSDFGNLTTLTNDVTVTEQGVDSVTEVVELVFTGSDGGASITLDGTTFTAGDAVTAAQLAAGLNGVSGDFENYEVVSVEGGQLVLRAVTAGDQTDLAESLFVISSDGEIVAYDAVSEISVDTQGAGWSYEIPTGTFSDPEGDELTYSAYVVTTDPETGAQSYTLIDGTTDPALGFEAETMTLSGNGTAPADTVIEIRAYDAVSGGTAASQFQLVVYNDAADDSLVAGAVPAAVAFSDGAGVGSYTLAASAFDYMSDSAGGLTYSAELANGEALPAWLSFDAATGTFTGNPPAGSGNVSVTVSATDGSATAEVSFDLTVAGEPNDLLALVAGGLADQSSAVVGDGGAVSINFAKPFIDPDGQADGAPTLDGISYTAFVQTADGLVDVADFGLTLEEDPADAGRLILSGNLAGEFASLVFVIRGTEENGGSTAETSFTLAVNDLGASDENIAAWSANSVGSISISGTPEEDAELTASLPTDADGVAPEDVTYQWQVSIDGVWTDIVSATGATFTPGDAEAGRDVRVQAFYTDAGGAAESPVSDAVTVANINDAGAVSLTSASVAVGSVWTSTLADGDGLIDAIPSYQWQRAASEDGVYSDIDGATYGSYTLTEDDSGMFLRLVASYTDDQGTEETVISGSREVDLSAAAPVAGDDSASITEASGAENATPGTAMPLTGDLLANDTDLNDGDVLSVTALRVGDREGIGRPAAQIDGSLVITGLYGTLNIDMATGAYSYELDQDNASVQALNIGSTPLVDVFNYTVSDQTLLSDTAVLSIEINGANDLPTLSGLVGTASVTEDSATRLDLLDSIVLGDPDSTAVSFTLTVDSGTLSISGVPAQVLADAGITVTGNHTGTLSLSGVSSDSLQGWLLDNGVYYTTAPNQTGEAATLSYSLADEEGSTLASETTTLDALATNDAPIVDASGMSFLQGDAETPARAVLNFRPTGTAQTLEFDGVSIEIAAGSTAAEIAALFAEQSFGTWSAEQLEGGSIVLLTALEAGETPAPTAGDFRDGEGAESALVLTGAGNDHDVRFSARGEAVLIAPNLMLSDIDGTELASATVTMTEGVFDNQFGTNFETLSLSEAAQVAATEAGLTVEITTDASGSVVSITGTASHAVYEMVLRGITYDNSNPNAYVGTREAVITVTDAEGQTSNTASVALSEDNDDIAVGQRIFIDGVDSGATVASVEDGRHFTASTPLDGVTEGATLSFYSGETEVTSAGAVAGHSATVAIGVVWAPYVDLNGAEAGTDHVISYNEQSPSVAIATSDAQILDQDGLTQTLTVTLQDTPDNDGETMLEYLTVSSTVLSWLSARGITIADTDGVSGLGGLSQATYVTFHAAEGAASTSFQVALRGVRYVNNDDDPDTSARSVTVETVDTDGNLGLSAETSITPVAVNDAPVGIDSTVGGTEDTTYVFEVADFGFSDPLDGGAHDLAAVVISTLPAAGILLLDGAAIDAGTSISRAQIAAGLLSYAPAQDASGEAAASFTFQVQDDGGTANGGVDLDATPATLTIDLDPRNDAPVLIEGAIDAASITEDATENAGQTVAALLSDATVTDIDTGDHSEDNGTLSGMAVYGAGFDGAGDGAWEYSLDGGDSWSTITLAEGEVLLLASDDMLRFVPDEMNGTTATLDYYAWDQATGESGDVVTAIAGSANAGSRGGESAFSAASGQITLEVADVNDAPVVTSETPAQTLAEDGTLTIVGLSLDDVDVSARNTETAADAEMTLTVSVSNGTLAFASVEGLTFDAGTNGENATLTVSGTLADLNAALTGLVYSPDADFHGADTLSVSVSDNGLEGEGTALIGTGSVALTVTPANDAPVLTDGDTEATSITEDDTTNAGQSVADLLGTVTDIDTGDHATNNGTLSGMAIYGTGFEGNGSGAWQYSLDDGDSWTTISLDEGEVLLLASDDLLRVLPDEENGTTATLDYYAWDQATGSSGEIVTAIAGANNLENRGGESAFSTASGQVTLEVTDVNDAPVVTVNGTGTFYARGEAAALFGGAGVSLSDVDTGDTIESAIAVLNPGTTLDNAFGTIYETITSTGGASFTASSGTELTITGTGTNDDPLIIEGTGSQADYEEALESLRYENTNPNAFAGVREVVVQIVDGAETPSEPTFFNFAVEWSTVVDLNGNAEGRDYQVSYIENAPGIAIAASDAELIDQEGNTDEVVLTLTDAVNGSAERLSITPAQVATFAALGITVVGNNTHQLTLTAGEGGLDPTYFQLAVRSVRYVNTSDAPTDAARHVVISATDSDGNPGVSATTTINVQPVNDAPFTDFAIVNTADGRDTTDLQIGDTLVIEGMIDDPDGLPEEPTSMQWLRDGEVVQTVTGPDDLAYVLDRDDVGHEISFRVIYTDLGGTEEEIETASTAAVINVNEAPVADDPAPTETTQDDVTDPVTFDLLSAVSDIDADYDLDTLSITALTFTVNGEATGNAGTDLPDGVSFADGTLSVDPLVYSELLEGEQAVIVARYTVTDTSGLSVEQTYTLTIDGTFEAPEIIGTEAGERLEATADGNVVRALGGDDTLVSGAGDDFLIGGEGSDTADYEGASGGVSVNLSATRPQDTGHGRDYLTGIENLAGSTSADMLIGDDVDNVLQGRAGNDTLLGDAGADSLYGNQGDDVLDGGEGDDWMHGGQGNDLLLGGAGGDILAGGHGDDTVDGGEGFDVLDFFTARDAVTVDLSITGPQLVSASEGTDTYMNVEGVLGGGRSDTLSGNELANLLDGGFGDDTMIGREGNDTLLGGAGNDTLMGDAGADSLYGNQGDDVLDGGDGDDWMHGGQGNDLLLGGTGGDTLAGGHGDDTVDGGEGFDVLDFFTARDSVTVDLSITNPQLVSATEGTDTYMNVEGVLGGGRSDTLSGNELANLLDGGFGDDTMRGREGDDTLLGSAGADSLYGNQGDDVLDGGEGDDWMHGGQDNDLLLGGTGGDTLAGGHGDDTVDGGEGFDVLDFFTARDGVTVDLSITGPQLVSATEGTDTYMNIEGVLGGRHSDTLSGNELANLLNGGLGNDTLMGREGDDTLLGDAGDDVLYGGLGTDVLSGGAGADTFAYVTSEEGGDTILDFDASEDVFRLSLDNFSGVNLIDPLTGDQLLWDAEAGTLSYDADGVGGEDAQLLATLLSDEEITLTSDNFLFV